ncbi:transmembrane protease serine 6-like [Spodoptera litura]|uniref:Transmembrane protease serine 6-like n=1 Tax=Spodoptera litura TaxID=69820 RepID=A0A9J7EWZ4_SPOLT|nr:transmembrane protease serine 6-like [Spodoptera litura]
MLLVVVLLWQIYRIQSVKLDVLDCGIDHALDVVEGDLDVSHYPWVGVLFYSYFGEEGDSRSVTTVVLIQSEFVIAAAADIGPMPKHNFRKNSRVLLGEGWDRPGRRVRNYVLHPEYEETYNTVALVQLSTPVRNINIRPVCPPPNLLRNPTFYVIKMKEDIEVLSKEVIRVLHIPGKMCKEFYVAANLYSKKMRPPHVACAVSLQPGGVCVWGAGGPLVARDVWGRWMLLGLGVRGPGCGAPSRYLDMMSYYPWVEKSLDGFNKITISKISKQKYVLRSSHNYQRFGNCDAEEKTHLAFRETIVLRTDNSQYQYLTYNITLLDNVEYTCMTMELVNASAVSEMRIKHFCNRVNFGAPCYFYRGMFVNTFRAFSQTPL